MNANTEIIVKDYNISNNLPIIQLVINFLHNEIITVDIKKDEKSLTYTQGFFATQIKTKRDWLEACYDNAEFAFLGYGKGMMEDLVEDYFFLLYILSLFHQHGKIYRSVGIEENIINEKVLVAFTHNKELKTIELTYNKECTEYYHMFSLLSLKSIIYDLLLTLQNNNITLKDIKDGKL